LKLSLIPRERRFYHLFQQQGELVSETLTVLSQSLSEGQSRHTSLRDLEHRCDDITREIYNLANRTFTTPIERADILHLAHSLDQVVDLAEEIADRIELYKVASITDAAKRMGECLASAGTQLDDATARLEEFNGLEPVLQEVHRLENEGDAISRVALQHLLSDGQASAGDIIKWNDLYSMLESALDECESVAEIIETIAIKNA
jgi:hypothetical protein